MFNVGLSCKIVVFEKYFQNAFRKNDNKFKKLNNFANSCISDHITLFQISSFFFALCETWFCFDMLIMNILSFGAEIFAYHQFFMKQYVYVAFY